MYAICIRFAKVQGEEEGRRRREAGGREDGMILKREPTHKECGGKNVRFCLSEWSKNPQCLDVGPYSAVWRKSAAALKT